VFGDQTAVANGASDAGPFSPTVFFPELVRDDGGAGLTIVHQNLVEWMFVHGLGLNSVC